MLLPLLKVGFFWNLVAAIWVLCGVILILVILIQKGKGGGLSGAFGGAAGGGILGSKTGDFLTWLTIVLVGVFLLLAVGLAKFYKPSSSGIDTLTPPAQSQPMEAPAPEIPSGTSESD